MEQHKVNVLVRRGSWIRKMVKESRSQIAAFQVTSTIILTVTIAFFVIVLGIFVNGRLRKFLISEDYTTTMQLKPTTSSSSIEQSMNDEFGDHWVAPRGLWHSMSDKELMWRASMVPQVKDNPYNRTRKVAFMFMTRKMLPLAPLWELFFKGHQGFYSIYLHTSSSFHTVDHPLESSVFYNRRIPSKAVEWGKASMVDAERRLLANALLDFSNERFILLSESCIPLFNFTTIYNYLINSKHSFVGSIDDPRNVGRGRYNKRMAPAILLSDWRKGNQWFELHRDLSIAVVSDVTYYPILRDHCRPPCYMDEHYLATLVTKI
ncbi:hypothetical protein SOVF_152440, partial [Spinacia oleracea]